MSRTFHLPVLVLLLCAVAITSADAASAADVPPAGAAAPAKGVDWEHMTFDQRKQHMKTIVFPELKKAFQAFDAKKYKNFTCATCHGDGATDGKFKMPNPKLPKLPPPTDREEFMALQQKKPEIAKFMGTTVKPKVAQLLGLPEWSPQSPKGFGCYDCHTMAGAK